MKKGLMIRLTAMLVTLCMMAGMAWTVSAAYPTPTNHIYDGADILSDSLVESIKSTNDALYSKVKARISICIVESLGGEEISRYAHAIFNEWKSGSGVLIVISTGDQNYYLIQSTNIESVLTNTRLRAITNEFLDPDFDEGNIAKGVQKTVNKLASFLKSELPSANSTAQSEERNPGNTDEKATVGSIAVSILRILGWTAVVLIAAFVLLFVAALFNDKAADLMYRLVFSHFSGKKKAPAARNYYDERLYGNPQKSQRQPQRGNPPPRKPAQNGQRPMYDRYQQGGIRYDDEYYGTREIQRNPPNRGSRQPSGSESNSDFERTRQVSIPNHRGNKGNR